MIVNLKKLPSMHSTQVVNFQTLNGGLNIRELSYRIELDESPSMGNLWWKDGILQSRDGQTWLHHPETPLGEGYTCYSGLFHGKAFFHIGTAIYYADMSGDTAEPVKLVDGVPENRGTFFHYLDWLFYKNKGGYFKVTYEGADAEKPFTCTNAAEDAYTPVILINGSPSYAGAGDLYQPENRLSAKKTVWFNAAEGVKTYYLPVSDITSVDKVIVDGVEKKVTTDYTVNLTNGTVTFVTAPPVTNPQTNNTVKITYSKDNTDAYNSIMDCEYAFVGGSNTNLCILLAGCDKQPNAIFWNSNDNLSMNPTYFPMSFYNFVGDTLDGVTGFGKQYSTLVVFKEHSVGKLEYGIEKVGDRDAISFTYVNINAKTGCDLPWTIQLVENNLVFCNTYQGVHVVRSASPAFENNIDCISGKVNGDGKTGLLQAVRENDIVCSVDDDYRYWLCAGDKVFLWDYVVSGVSDPSWFYFTNVKGIAYLRDDTNHTYHLDSDGYITKFEPTLEDYNGAIDKWYQFPVMSFGDYAARKDVLSVIFAIKSENDTHIRITYDSDYEQRDDLTDLSTWSWTYLPRDLSAGSVGPAHYITDKYARVSKRKPGCRHVKHFTMRLSNNEKGRDLALVSAQVYFRFTGEER